MRRFIFHRKSPNKLVEKLRPSHIDAAAPIQEGEKQHPSTGRLAKNLTEKNLRIGAIITLIAGGFVWLEQDNSPNMPTKEQVITLPDVSSKTNQPTTDGIAPPVPVISLPPAPPVLIASIPPANNHITTAISTSKTSAATDAITIDNRKAVQSAINGDPYSAVTQLEAALLNDPQAGQAFDNLRRLYAGFATQSYQLAMDPNKNSTVVVELSDAQQKHSIQIPVMANSGINRTVPTNDYRNMQVMPNLPPVIALTENKESAIQTPQTIDNNTTAQAEAIVKQPSAVERKEINQAIMLALKSWGDAWSKQDVENYLQSYHPNYAPKGTSHKDWADYRKIRLKAPKFINVELTEQKAILLDATHARVHLIQAYTSDTLKSKDKKTIELELIDHKWLITSESGR